MSYIPDEAFSDPETPDYLAADQARNETPGVYPNRRWSDGGGYWCSECGVSTRCGPCRELTAAA